MKFDVAIKNGCQELKKNNISSALLDSEILLQKAIKKDRKFLILNPKKKIKTNKVKIFKTLVRRRQKGEPISYIINTLSTQVETYWTK